jgi:hypothetical protein
MTPADFKGVTLDNLVILEQVFSLNVYVYDLQETEAGDIGSSIRVIPVFFLLGRRCLLTGLCCIVHATRILVDNISDTGPFMSVLHPYHEFEHVRAALQLRE